MGSAGVPGADPAGNYAGSYVASGASSTVRALEIESFTSAQATTDAVGTEVQEIIPVYCKNTRYTMSIDAENPTPLNLYSMTWEGDYNQKYYKNV